MDNLYHPKMASEQEHIDINYHTELMMLDALDCPPPIKEAQWERCGATAFSCRFDSELNFVREYIEYIERHRLGRVFFRITREESQWSAVSGSRFSYSAFTNDLEARIFPESYYAEYEWCVGCFADTEEEALKEILKADRFLSAIAGIDDDDSAPPLDQIQIVPVKKVNTINDVPQ